MATATLEEEVTVTISGVPKWLVAEIDRIAALEDRSRSAFIRRELEQRIERLQEAAKKEAKK